MAFRHEGLKKNLHEEQPGCRMSGYDSASQAQAGSNMKAEKME